MLNSLKNMVILFTLTQALNSFVVVQAMADQATHQDKTKLFLNSVLYGIGAGTLVGAAAITNFKRNFNKNIDFGNVARGASYGLYGGIVIGMYLTHWAPEVDDKAQLNLSLSRKDPDQKMLGPLTTTDCQPIILNFQPLFRDTRLDGAMILWNILEF